MPSLLQRLRRRLSIRTKDSDIVARTSELSPISVLDVFSFPQDQQHPSVIHDPVSQEKIRKETLQHHEQSKNRTFSLTESYIEQEKENIGTCLKETLRIPPDNLETLEQRQTHFFDISNDFLHSRKPTNATERLATSQSTLTRVFVHDEGEGGSHQLSKSTCELQLDDRVNRAVFVRDGVNEGKTEIITGTKDKRTHTAQINRVTKNVPMTGVRAHKINLPSETPNTVHNTATNVLPATTYLKESCEPIPALGMTSTKVNIASVEISTEGNNVCVEIVDTGPLKGKVGKVVDFNGKKSYTIEVEGKLFNKRASSIRFLNATGTSSTSPIHDSIDRGYLQVTCKPIPATSKNFTKVGDARVEISIEVNNALVRIVDTGPLKGKIGKVVNFNGKKTYTVEIEGKLVKKRATSICFLNATGMYSTGPMHDFVDKEHLLETFKRIPTTSTTSTERNDTSVETSMQCNDKGVEAATEGHNTYVQNSTEGNNSTCVEIVDTGRLKGKVGKVVHFNGKKTYTIEVEGDIVKKRASSIRFLNATAASSTGPNQLSVKGGWADWQVADSDHGGTRFGSRVVRKLRISFEERKEISFLNDWLNTRIQTIEISFNENEMKRPVDATIDQDNAVYDLVSAKLRADGDEGGFSFAKKQCLNLVYAKVSAPMLAPLSIDSELLKIANFSVLPPRKVMARLELLQSPACVPLITLEASEICRIPENGHVGCGFISNEKLNEICGVHKAGNVIVAIQVRLFVPSMGIFKGMLCRKRIPPGSPAIQLPDSMLKVPKSNHPDAYHGAKMVICTNGMHPSPKGNAANNYIGRRLDPDLRDPPLKSFKSKISKPLSDMILRLFRAVDVPQDVCNNYKIKSVTPEHRNHAWAVGLADPTGLLPGGHVFCTGMKDSQPSSMFVTRVPCVKSEDCRMLPTVTTKPDKMSLEDWEWLTQLSFGTVIFANPAQGMMSMPERIADGDLDGDLYFVCWDSEILSYARTEALVDIPIGKENVLASCEEEDPDWFKKTQDLMVDAELLKGMDFLMKKCYTLSKDIADKSPLFMRDPDAVAFADAFNQTLKFGKHGGKISLPHHLQERLPLRLHHYVEWM